jgi:hypothetical protein
MWLSIEESGNMTQIKIEAFVSVTGKSHQSSPEDVEANLKSIFRKNSDLRDHGIFWQIERRRDVVTIRSTMESERGLSEKNLWFPAFFIAILGDKFHRNKGWDWNDVDWNVKLLVDEELVMETDRFTFETGQETLRYM